MMPYIPDGYYQIPGTTCRAGVYYINVHLSSEVRVCWVSDDAHTLLNEMLGKISVLELDHLVKAAVQGDAFTVDPLEDLFPRPGWEINTQSTANPLHYSLRELDSDLVDHGSRLQLLVLLELATRSALAAYIGQPASRDWIQRLRDVHPQITHLLADQSLFEPEF